MAGLEAQLEALRAERATTPEPAEVAGASGRTVAELEQELQQARTDREEELGSLQARVTELQAVADRVHEIDAELQGARAATAEREEQLETARQNAIEQQQLLETARQVAEQHEHDLGLVRTEAQGFSEQLRLANERVELVQAELDQLQGASASSGDVASSRIAELEAELSNVQQEATQLDNTVAELDAGTNPIELLRRINDLERELEEAKSASGAADLESEVLTLRADSNRLADLEAEAIELRQLASQVPELEPVSYTHLTLPTICSV